MRRKAINGAGKIRLLEIKKNAPQDWRDVLFVELIGGRLGLAGKEVIGAQPERREAG
jgi:hypothetical protein